MKIFFFIFVKLSSSFSLAKEGESHVGVDFGWGFDELDHMGQKPGFVTSFTIGQQF